MLPICAKDCISGKVLLFQYFTITCARNCTNGPKYDFRKNRQAETFKPQKQIGNYKYTQKLFKNRFVGLKMEKDHNLLILLTILKSGGALSA